jgi:hypothetical protein
MIAEIAEQGQGAAKEAWPGGAAPSHIVKYVFENEKARLRHRRKPPENHLALAVLLTRTFSCYQNPVLDWQAGITSAHRFFESIPGTRAAEPAATLCREDKWL